MYRFRSMLSGFVLLGASAIASASGWGVPTTITGYYVYENGEAYITTANNQNPDGCGSYQYLHLASGAPNFKAIWASVIAAQASGSTVSLNYSGCGGGPYPHIIAVAVPNVW